LKFRRIVFNIESVSQIIDSFNRKKAGKIKFHSNIT